MASRGTRLKTAAQKSKATENHLKDRTGKLDNEKAPVLTRNEELPISASTPLVGRGPAAVVGALWTAKDIEDHQEEKDQDVVLDGNANIGKAKGVNLARALDPLIEDLPKTALSVGGKVVHHGSLTRLRKKSYLNDEIVSTYVAVLNSMMVASNTSAYIVGPLTARLIFDKIVDEVTAQDKSLKGKTTMEKAGSCKDLLDGIRKLDKDDVERILGRLKDSHGNPIFSAMRRSPFLIDVLKKSNQNFVVWNSGSNHFHSASFPMKDQGEDVHLYDSLWSGDGNAGSAFGAQGLGVVAIVLHKLAGKQQPWEYALGKDMPQQGDGKITVWNGVLTPGP